MQFGIMGFQAELEQGIVGTEKPAGLTEKIKSIIHEWHLHS